ncbi:MAG: apolipoprotein N-acyltransferase [Actinomycetota bacterium]|nr:apolipoprotein N-acyltransferase [Actinomycetota bacterium]
MRTPVQAPRIPTRWAAGLVVVAGLAGVVAFPRPGIWPLAAVSVALFSVAVHGRGACAGAWLGYLYGWAFFGPLLTWTGTFVGPVWLLLPFAEAGAFALLGAALPSLQRLPAAPIWVGAAWVGEEALRDRFPFGGFPWGRWAFSQAESPLRWFAALGGAPLVTFAVALAGALLVVAAPALVAQRWWAAALASAAALLVPLIGWTAQFPLRAGPAPRTEVIALIQGDVPDRGLEFNARRRQVLDNHVARTLDLAAAVKAGRTPAPSLVVWPENAADIDPLDNADARAQVERAVRTVGAPILVGAILDGPGDAHVRNVGIMWSPTTGPGAQYVKRHPVPFGEYLPWRAIATAITAKAALIGRDMVAGSGNGVVSGGPAPIGDVICFEVAYDGLVRSSVAAGAQLLVVQTNNATFGHSAETYQQLAMTKLRAVEHGRTVIQVATSGTSAMVGPDGRVIARSGALFTPAVIVRRLGLYTAQTPATRIGAWPEWTLTVVALLALGWAVGSRRAAPRHPTGPASNAGLPAAGTDDTVEMVQA